MLALSTVPPAPHRSSSGSLSLPERETEAPCPTAAKRAPVGELRVALASMRDDLVVRAIRLARDRAIAEDLVHETVERALRFESRYRLGTSPRAWVFQILFRVFVTSCRRRRRQGRAMSAFAVDPGSGSGLEHDGPRTRMLGRGLALQLQSLPEPYRRAVELVDLGELSYRDAALVLEVPVGTVMSRLHRGRALLRAQLADEHALLAA